MKKIVIFLFAFLFLTTGCSEDSTEDLIDNFISLVEESESYLLTGTMEIFDGQDTYSYTLESSYLEGGYYKVVLINTNNDHEQVILRTDDEVYVITPSLNKSFKFDSIWPDNSSQSYLLHSLVNDINEDDEYEFSETESGYQIKTTVNYPNNGELLYQIINFDSDMGIKSVVVYDENDTAYITVTFTSTDLSAGLSVEDFALENYVDQEDSDEEETDTDENVCEECDVDDEDCENDCSTETTALDSILYPLYLPTNTSLETAESVMTDYSERVILTFSGETNFVLIEESSTVNSDMEIIPITGNPVLLNDTVAAMSTNSMYFTKNGVDYYLVSNDLTTQEMVSIANSVGSVESVMSTK